LRVTVCDYYGGRHPLIITGWIGGQHTQLASTSVTIDQPLGGLNVAKACASKDVSISLKADGAATYLWIYASSPSGERGYVFDPTNKMVDLGGNAVTSFLACKPVVTPTRTPTPTPTPTATPTKTATPTATPTLQTVQPVAECIDVRDSGTLIGHFGYRNTADREVVIPVGDQNFLSPGRVDRGQPTRFVAGRITNAFQATFNNTTTLRWTVGDRFADVSIATVRCEGDTIECTETDNKASLAVLDNTARVQRNKVIEIANRIIRFAGSNVEAVAAAEEYVSRARALYLAQWRDIWSSFPQITQSCVGTRCVQRDKSGDIEAIKARSARFIRLARSSAALLNRVTRNKDRRVAASLLQEIKARDQRCRDVAAELPRFDSICQ
jgi:hypothetical protein